MELGLFSLEKRRLRGHLSVAFQYLRGVYKQEENQHLTQSNSDRTRENGFKLKVGRFGLDVRQKIFTQRAVRPWHSCPESCGCLTPRGAQGQAEWGPGQPDLVLD